MLSVDLTVHNVPALSDRRLQGTHGLETLTSCKGETAGPGRKQAIVVANSA